MGRVYIRLIYNVFIYVYGFNICYDGRNTDGLVLLHKILL